ncbi:lysozyme [Lelliottia sp. CFBP8978]|nr:lysozyme [Lelliottia sp. CFBP8978]
MKSYEKLYKLPYWDQNGKLISEYKKGATIGYGHLISSEKEFAKYKKGITESQAVILFKNDIYSFIQTVRYEIKEKITQNEFDALVMLAFNIGIYAFKISSILRIINGEFSGDLKEAWKSYKYTQGRISRGLINRRDAEINVFFNGVYFKK